MGPITLTWLAAVIFSGLVFWGVNVPTSKRTPALYWITGLLIVLHLFTQSYLFRVDTSPSATVAAKRTAVEAMANFEKFLSAMAVGPGKLHYRSPPGWYRIVTSSFLHYGWLHLIFNAWFFVLFGHVLEHVFGAKKFCWLVAAGLIIPPALDGFFPVGLSRVDVRYTGGFSGVVYAVMGAYLVCFPNSRAYGAVNYDLRFWGSILFFLLPVTMVTRFAGVALTETVIIMGIVAAFLLIQPEHARISTPVITVMLYKVLQDILLLEPAVREVFSNSVWRIGGGFAVGIVGGFVLNGTRGWKLRWGDATKEGKGRSVNTRTRMSVAKLEAEGRKSPEGARVYLGQRVFVGDAEKAIAFYREVIMTKYPEVALPLQEQMALARLLHFKGYDVEALHAYETLLKAEPLPEEFSLARLKAAELMIKLTPERWQRAKELLDRFEHGRISMVRDKVEAQRLREMLPVVVQKEYHENDRPQEVASGGIYTEAGKSNVLFSTASLRSVGGAEREGKEAEVPVGIDAPKVRPRSFLYVPGAAPVAIGERKRRRGGAESDDAELLSDSDLLKRHWKPIPPMMTSKPLPVSVLDRPVKNARFADEGEKPSLYGGADSSAKDYRNTGRISQLELVKFTAEVSASNAEAAGLYGGLEDVARSPMDQPLERIRLRREKNTPEGDSQTRARQTRARHTADVAEVPANNWERRIEPTAITVVDADSADVSYGEPEGAGPLATDSGKKWAVLLTDPDQVLIAKELKSRQPEIAEKYGVLDFSEVLGSGFNPLFVFRNVPDSDVAQVQESADALQLNIHFIAEDDRVLMAEPVEVVAVIAGDEGLQFRTAYGNRRVVWEEIALVSLADIRLTPNSRGLHRLLLEIVVMSGNPQRYQVFERTLSLKGSSLAKTEASNPRELLEKVWAFSAERASGATLNPAAGTDGGQHQAVPVFESYAWYNEEILRLLVLGSWSR